MSPYFFEHSTFLFAITNLLFRYILLDQQFGLSRLSYINYASVNSEKGRELKKIAVINLSHLQGAFYMLAGGIVISCIIFLLEILRHKN